MPDWTGDLRGRLAPLRLTPVREAEIVEELSQHLDQRYEELRGEGKDHGEARRLAMEELLEPDALASRMAALRQANVRPSIAPGAPPRFLLVDLWQDLRYAGRVLRRQPGFAAVAVLTLALGIGANSAMFALVDATLLRPLPLHEPGRLVMVWERTQASNHEGVSPLNLLDWNERNRSFDLIAGFVPSVGGMVMAGANGSTEEVPRQWVTVGFFRVLGVRPIAGRGFVASDDRERARVVVLSEAFWRTHFNADASIVGRDIRLDGAPYKVVGVVPNQVQLLGRTSVWALRPIQGAPPAARAAYFLQAVGRLKRGVTLEVADADMAAVAKGLAQDFPKTNKGRGVSLEPLRVAVIGNELRQTSILFLGVVAFVLLICCANVANLLLARATVRTRELAIRSALGADRRRVIRQLLTESLVLSTIGGALGMGVGAAILAVAPLVIPAGLLPAAVTLAFDARLVVFCALAALLVGLLFGLAPAWQATSRASAQALASEGRAMTGRGGRLRNVLVAAQVATAVVLLFGAGLLLRTLLAVEGVDRGYRAESVLTMMVDPLGSSYPTEASLLQFYDAIDREVMGAPGVRSVAWASTLPLGPSYFGQSFFQIVGDAQAPESQPPAADYQIVSPGYFRTVDLPVVAGRSFDERDTSASPQVCMVNEAFVRRYLHGRSPVGRRVAVGQDASPQAPSVVREIVGVARQVKGRPDETQDLLQIYVPMAQDPMDDMFIVVRPKSGRAGALASSVRAAIARVDKEQLVSVRDVLTLEDVQWEATARHRFRAVLVVAFALLALALAMVGLSGILAYSVQQRVREFGVRRALGATSPDVLRSVVGGAIRVVAAGAIVGFALSAAFSRLVVTLLFGVQPLDATTFAWVTIVLAVTAVVATAAPAWRATRVDPAIALRGE
jgi:putative ABC transport system permease protein